MGMPKHIFLEVISLSAEFALLDEVKPQKLTQPQIDRRSIIIGRLEKIERAYTFDSDQEEQMV